MDVIKAFSKLSVIEEQPSREPELSVEQKKIFKEITEGDHKYVFITGGAGTGKSFLLKKLRSFYTNCVVVAPTGIAALNVEGKTIHSHYHISLNKLFPKKTKKDEFIDEIIFIDEISMVTETLFMQIMTISNTHKKIICFGDFLQLPSVGDEAYLHESYTWFRLKFKVFELFDHQRQKDKDFYKMLNLIRFSDKKKLLDVWLSIINDDSKNINIYEEKYNKYLCLYATNVNKDTHNNYKYNQIDKIEYSFTAKVYAAKEKLYTDVEKILPKKVHYKIGCRVMLIKNTPDLGIVNGDFGFITNIYPYGCEVLFDRFSDKSILIKPDMWLWTNSWGKIIASYTQIPLVLGYACTIHKSQGVSSEFTYIDCSGIFTNGQFYVAISRATTFENLIIQNYNKRCIKSHTATVNKYVSDKW